MKRRARANALRGLKLLNLCTQLVAKYKELHHAARVSSAASSTAAIGPRTTRRGLRLHHRREEICIFAHRADLRGTFLVTLVVERRGVCSRRDAAQEGSFNRCLVSQRKLARQLIEARR
jgi:hypothetical protein